MSGIGNVWTADHDPQGRYVVTASDDGTARVWDLVEGREMAVLRGHAGPVASAQFTRDGRVTSASSDDSWRLWDWRTGDVDVLLTGNADATDAELSPDGTRLLLADGNGIGRIVACDTCGDIGQVAALARRRLARDLTEQERRSYLTQP